MTYGYGCYGFGGVKSVPLPLPTVDFNFLVSEALDPRITAAGGANGTRINASGLIVSASCPRYNYDPVMLAPRGVLTEDARTNLVLYSEQFDNAAWTKNAATITADQAAAPDGASTGDMLSETTANAVHEITQSLTVTSGTTYVLSIFVKKGPGATAPDMIQMSGSSALFGASQWANFNIANGTIVNQAGGTAAIVSYGNGWYRLMWAVVATASASGQSAIIAFTNNNGSLGRLPAYAGVATSNVYIWGADCEAGAAATSYIQTVAAQVTRSADSLSVTGANFSAFWNPIEGSGVMEWEMAILEPSALSVWQIMTDATNYIGLRAGTLISGIDGYMRNGGVSQIDTLSGAARIGRNGTALAWSATSSNLAVNGALIQADDPAATIPVCNQLVLAAAGYHAKHIRRFRYYANRVNNSQLMRLAA